MKKYLVKFQFNGYGSAIVKAEDRTEAEEKFSDGDTVGEKESGTNYEITTIERQ